MASAAPPPYSNSTHALTDHDFRNHKSSTQVHHHEIFAGNDPSERSRSDRRSKNLIQRMVGTKDSLEDVYFAVMGLTGSGKTSFISMCTGKESGVGHSLRSCTISVEDYTFVYQDKFRVHLIDTPGFDDTERDDTDVLRDIAGWLATTYDKGIRLSGIMYLQSISSSRVGGSAMRNLFMFKKLMGPKCFSLILLVTTFWGNVDPTVGATRERELIQDSEFWGEMYQNGSQAVRHTNDRASALRILDSLIKRRHPMTVLLQHQIVEEGRDLDKTDAGQQLNADLIRMQEIHEKKMANLKKDMEEAIIARDQEAADQIAKMQEKVSEKIAKAEEERESLRVDLDRINKEREEEMKKYRSEIENAMETMRQKNAEYDELKSSYVSRDELDQKKSELEELRAMIENSRAAASRKQTGFWDSFGEFLDDVAREVASWFE